MAAKTTEILAFLAIAGYLCSMVLVWWKVSTDNKLIKRELALHEEKIILILASKASCADLIKLAEIVDALDKRVLLHHEDTKKHRTEDFEQRITTLIQTVNDVNRANAEAHDKIMQMIRELGR